MTNQQRPQGQGGQPTPNGQYRPQQAPNAHGQNGHGQVNQQARPQQVPPQQARPQQPVPPRQGQPNYQQPNHPQYQQQQQYQQYHQQYPGYPQGQGPQKKKKRVSMGVLPFVLMLLFTITASVFGTYGVLKLVADTETNTVTQTTDLPKRLLEGLSDSYSLLKSTYIGDLDEEALIDSALKGFVAGAGDKYTSYLNAAEYANMSQTTDSSFVGVGIEIEQYGEYIRIVSPYDNTPASKAGLQPNDIIIKVDGTDIAGKATSDVSKMVRGEKGTSVTLTIRRGSQEFSVTMVRDTIPLTSVTANMDATNPTVGVIRISSFAKTTYDELVEAIKDLRTKGAKSFVLDVRNNPGGLIDSVQRILNVFLEDGTVLFKMEDREKGVQTYKASSQLGTFKATEPVVVLMNSGSASASEILASSLSENGRAKLVGKTTYGKGTAQTIRNLTATTAVKITFSKWLTPNGTWVHEKGIAPDVDMELPAYSKLSVIDSSKVYKKGDSSEEVLNVQRILRELGFEADLTATFDDKTEAAVKKFQESKSIEQSGTVTENTAVQLSQALRDKIKNNDTQLEAARNLLK